MKITTRYGQHRAFTYKGSRDNVMLPVLKSVLGLVREEDVKGYKACLAHTSPGLTPQHQVQPDVFAMPLIPAPERSRLVNLYEVQGPPQINS